MGGNRKLGVFMGDRVLIIFKDKTEVSPTCYLHWGGANVLDNIEKIKKYMGSRIGDLPYTCARFLGLLHSQDPNSSSGMGVWNTPKHIGDAIIKEDSAVSGLLEDYSHGDAGVIVVDVCGFTWKAYAGYIARDQEKSEGRDANN